MLEPRVEGIPNALKAVQQWVLWRVVDRGGKRAKIPFQQNGKPASSTDPGTWADFDTVLLAYNEGGYSGVGFVLSESDRFCGADFDHCRNRETGEIDQTVLDAVNTLDSYSEISPSGEGVRVIFAGGLPEGKNVNAGAVEFYQTGRYLTITGHVIRDKGIRQIPTDQLREVRNRLIPQRVKSNGNNTASHSAVSASTITDLRSALAWLSSDDRKEWVDVGHDLKTLGDQGHGLFIEWSAKSDKYDPRDAERVWKSCNPTNTGHQAVFAKAQRAGWVNPKKRPDNYISTNDRGQTSSENEKDKPTIKRLVDRYVYVADQNRFYDTKTGALLELEAVGNAWAHLYPKPKAHTILLADAECRKADTITYWPGVEDGLVEHGGSMAVNTWRPSTLKLPAVVTDDDVFPWLELVYYLIPEKANHAHLIDWMAAILQQPHRKINHALLLAGRERVGKDTIIQPLIYGLGTWNVNQPLAEELLEQFTDYLHNAKLVIFQEIQNFEKLSIQNKLKPMLASPPEALRVRLFNRGFYETPNIVQCLFMSNHKDALKISDSDPRYFAVWCDKQRLPDSYYSELYGWLNDGGHAKVVRWLLDRDISSFNFAGPAPDTEFKREIRRLGRSSLEMELSELIDGEVFPFDIDFIRPLDVYKNVRGCTIKSLARALDELGHVRREERVTRGGGRQRHTMWIIRNHDQLRTASFSTMIDRWELHIAESN